jgi:signal transduction histidine kinase/ActR/RegA family two-component response regulator
MAERIRAFDWSPTSVGPIDAWPAALRTATDLMLGTRQPAYIAWGPDHLSLYNEAYIPILGSKHPHALGQPYATLWSEIWEQFRPIVAATMNGDAQYFEDLPVALAGRAGRPMSWFTFSWTPLRDDTGRVGGFYCAAHETTDRVLGTSFLASLGDALRPLDNPLAVQETAARLLCEHLHANRVAYFEVSPTEYVIERDATDGVAALRGRFPIDSTGSSLLAALQSGRPLVARNVADDPGLSAKEKAEYATLQIGARVGVPLLRNGGLVAGLTVHTTAPRQWSDTEVALVTEVAERTCAAVERATAEAAVRASEAKYRALFESMDQGYCIIELIFDAEQRPFDYRFIEVNPAYEKQAGLTNVLGKRASELLPGLNTFWFETFGRIATSGEAERFQSPAVAQDYSHIFDVFAFRVGDPDERRVAVLFTDISTQVQARESLRDADRRKDEFLATLAHELRNPLAPLRTGLELMRLAGSNAPPFDSIQGMMKRQVEHMVRMIDDLLDVSRITAGRIHLQRKPTFLADLVASAVEANSAAVESAALNLVVTLPDHPVQLDVDGTRVAQVLSNLLNNAIKFTPAGGRIVITAGLVPHYAGKDGMLEVSVADTGEGIPETLLPRVFDLFTQGERPPRGSQAGLGIGLALSRRLIELHGGRIDATSEGPGQGTTVTFQLPVLGEGAAPAETPARGTHHKPQRMVVVIDDNQDAADMMAMLIAEFGSQALVAYDGESGLEHVLASRPDVVFLDIGMPGLDGYETCRRIRVQCESRPYIVALTGWGQEHDKKRAAEAGFDAHLTKPADPRAIEQLLATVLPTSPE